MTANIKEHFYIAYGDVLADKETKITVDTDDLAKIFANGVENVIGKLSHFDYHNIELRMYKSTVINGETFKSEDKTRLNFIFADGLVDYQAAMKTVPEIAAGESMPNSIFDGIGRVTQEDRDDYIEGIKDIFVESAKRDDVISDKAYKKPFWNCSYGLIKKSTPIIDINSGKILYQP